MEKVIVHPLVQLSIVDNYNRNTRKRVVGVLIGSSSRGTVDVTNCCAVPFEEDDKDPSIWFLDHIHLEAMFSVFNTINAKEHVVGWYSTGPKLRENDLDVHALFNGYIPNPVLVIIDVQPKELVTPTKAYYVVEEAKENATQKSQKIFVHVPSEIAAHEVEEIGVEHSLMDVKDTTISTLATEGLSWKAMSLDPKVVFKFEPKDSEIQTSILNAEFVDFEYNSYGAHLLSFNIKNKMSKFNGYVKEVMGSDNALEAIQGLDKMIYQDTRLAYHLEPDLVERLVKILQETDKDSIKVSAAYILSRVKHDTCHFIIRKAIPVLMGLLCEGSSIVALPVVISLTRLVQISPNYIYDILEENVLERVYYIVEAMNWGTILIESLAKFIVVLCRGGIIFVRQERQYIAILDRILLCGLSNVHLMRVCHALEILSCGRRVQIKHGTISKLTQLSCNEDNMVAGSALGVLKNIVTWGDSNQCEMLAKDSNLLRCLQTSLLDSKPMKLQWEVCEIISEIADRMPTFAQEAKDHFSNHSKLLVKSISETLQILKLGKGDLKTFRKQPYAIKKLNQIMEFNALLIALKIHPDTRRFAGGLGLVSFLGCGIEMDDLKLLYKTYATYSFSSGRVEEDKLAALHQLGNIIGLSEREADNIKLVVTATKYRDRVAQSIKSGRFTSDFLLNLCRELKFDVHKAVKINEDIYQQKLKLAVAYREITDEKSLERFRCVILDIHSQREIEPQFPERD